jgi:hypothetical protein
MSSALEKVFAAINELNTEDIDCEDLVKFRKDTLSAMSELGKKLSETATTDFNSEDIKNYCKELISCSLESKELPQMPYSVESKRNSKGATSIIKVLLETFDFNKSSALLQIAYKQVSKAKTVAELKSALKVYALAQEQDLQIKEMQEHIKWLSDMVDNQEKDLKVAAEAKRQNEEIFKALKEDDEELSIVLQARNLKVSYGLSDTQVSSALGLDRNKLNRLRMKFKFVETM